MSAKDLNQGNSIYKEILQYMKKYVNIFFINIFKIIGINIKPK